MKFSRRRLLGAGGATLALPFLESLTARRAFAAGLPPRLVVFVTHEGTVQSRWMPPAGALGGSISQMLAPLAPFASKLNVVSGVSNRVNDFCRSNGPNASSRTLLSAHLTATAANASGALIAENAQSETQQHTPSIGPSFDQSIASALGITRTMNLSISSIGETRAFYRTAPATAAQPNGARALVDQLNDPVTAFNTFIAPQLGAGSGGMDAGTPMAQPFPLRLANRRPRVLDAVNGSLKTLKTRVSAEDRLRLEQHEASIERYEASVLAMQPPDAGAPMGTTPMAACRPQVLPANHANRTVDYFAWYSAQLDVLVNGLACGVTRIASFQDHDMYSPPFRQFMSSPSAALTSLGAIPFPAMQGDWHGNVHGSGGGGVGDRETNASLQAGFLFYAAMFRLLLERMNAVIEPNGASLLDNSVVVWLSEFGHGGAHSTQNLPIVLAGSNGGRLTTGRHVALANRSTGAYISGGSSTNDLYLSLHRQMEVTSVPRFGYAGDSSLHRGGIPELER